MIEAIKPRILIIDDEETIRNSLSIILEDEGFLVDTAESGLDAIKKTSEINYNIALIDICLPDMEGTKLLTKTKTSVPKIRKIILTGHPSVTNAIDAVNKNADAYLIKPVKVDDLLNVISQQFKLQQEERDSSEKKVAEFVEYKISQLKNNKKF
jgi:DNA-binding NtrC family response regulator